MISIGRCCVADDAAARHFRPLGMARHVDERQTAAVAGRRHRLGRHGRFHGIVQVKIPQKTNKQTTQKNVETKTAVMSVSRCEREIGPDIKS